MVHPATPIKADAIRIHMLPRKDAAVGILELRVE